MSNVTLKDLSFSLQRPLSLAAAFDVAVALPKNQQRAMYAALGLCWGGPKPLRSKYSASYNVLEYGGNVCDELLAYGATMDQISTAAAAALTVLVEALPSESGVQAAEAFTEGPER